MKKLIAPGAVAFVVAFIATIAIRLWPDLTRPNHVDLAFQTPSPLELFSLPTAMRFDFPLFSALAGGKKVGSQAQ